MSGGRWFGGEWETRRLGNHLRFLRHSSLPRSYLAPHGQGGRGVKYLHYGDIHTSERVYLDPTATALPSLAKDHARRLDRLSDGDLVFVDASEDIGGVGKSVEIMGSEGRQLVSGLHTIAVRFNKAVLANGFKAYLQFCPRFRDHLRRLAAGTKVYATNRAHIATAELRVPSLPEQRAIAAVLTDVDALIGSLEALIAKKRAIKRATMQQLLTGRTRLPGFSGEWERERLGDIASFHKGRGLAKSELSLDGSRRCIHYGELFTVYRERITEAVHGIDREGAFLCSNRNDVLMPTSDVTPNGLATASCILAPDIIIGGDILVIRVPESVLNGEFLAYAIRANRDQIMQLVSGTTVFHLYGRDMAHFMFSTPSVAEQRAIVAVLCDMDTEITALERRLDKTRAIKQGMMQKLLTGMIRLPIPDAGAEDAPGR